MVIPVYNGRTFLRKAVESVLSEQIPNMEIIIVDDGSTDRGLETIADLDVKKTVLPKNQGQAAAMNVGVKTARGHYIAFLDSDDVLAKDAMVWRCEWLFQFPQNWLVAGRIAGIIDQDGKYLGSYHNVLNPKYKTPPTLITRDYLESGGEFPSQLWQMLFRKDFLEMVGPLDESLRCAHDNDYFYRILTQCGIPFIDKPTVFYRMHDNNISGRFENGKFNFYKENIAENLMVHLTHGISPRNS